VCRSKIGDPSPSFFVNYKEWPDSAVDAWHSALGKFKIGGQNGFPSRSTTTTLGWLATTLVPTPITTMSTMVTVSEQCSVPNDPCLQFSMINFPAQGWSASGGQFSVNFQFSNFQTLSENCVIENSL